MSDLTITVAIEGQGEVEQVVLEDRGMRTRGRLGCRSTHLNTSVATLGRGKLLSLTGNMQRKLAFEYKIRVASLGSV